MAEFSLIVYFYAIGPEQVGVNVLEAVVEAHQEDLQREIAEPARLCRI